MSTINCNGNLIDLSKPRVMGILNLTPDSFYDGGRNKSKARILKKVERMLEEGATFIDIGGYSSRPGASDVEESEEAKRVLPIVEALLAEFPEILISIDTFRSTIVIESVARGACMVNDISGGNLDPRMFETISKLQIPYILMHMPGNPKTMQKNTHYENLILDITYYFSKKISELRALNVNDVIIDVGFGFGKTLQQNYELLKNLEHFKFLNVPILSGISRKSMLYKVLNTTPQETLNATTVANTLAVLNGSDILRVHDVREAVETLKILEAYNA